jgi:hypothetical protein
MDPYSEERIRTAVHEADPVELEETVRRSLGHVGVRLVSVDDQGAQVRVAYELPTLGLPVHIVVVKRRQTTGPYRTAAGSSVAEPERRVLWPMTCVAEDCSKAPFPTTGYCSRWCEEITVQRKRIRKRGGL